MIGRGRRALGAGAVLALGVASVLAVLALSGMPGGVVIAAGGAAGVALLLVGLHHRRVPLTEAWPWVLAGSGLWTVGASLHDMGSGSGALVGLALEAAALVGLGGGLMGRSGPVAAGDRLPLIDAMVVMVAGAFPVYILLTEAALALADPLRVLLLLGQLATVAALGTVGFAVAVGEPRRAVSTRMLVAATTFAVAAHGVDQLAVLHASPDAVAGVLLPLLAVGAPLMAGAAAWAPDASVDLAARRAARHRTGAGQIVMIGVSSILVPAVIGVEMLTNHAVHLGQGLALAVVLITLVMTRVLVVVKRLERQTVVLESRVWTDPVTGLGNRDAFLGRLDARDEPGCRGGHLVLLDLDRYTELRDALGVATTDALLREVGARVAEAATRGYVARLGSGAFGIVLPEAVDRDQAHLAARALLAPLDRPLVIGELTLQVEAAAGVVFLDEDSSSEQLLQSADLALEEARRAPGRVASFGSGTGSGAGLSLLLPDLRAALEHGDLVLHFQPQVDIASGHVTAVEALVRWQHPVHGLVAPGAFIPLAERTGFIGRITRYVLDQALELCAQWRTAGTDVAVAVNLSVQDLLDPGLVEFVRRALERHGLPPSALELEVTETDAMVDPERSVATMAALASLGVTLSVDDFGTGYSSLAYLGRLPVRRLKIDRGFVAGMRVDDASVAIVAATLDLAGRLGLQVVAEGVEDDETYRELAAMGCDAAQGFGLSRPVPAEALPGVVRALDTRVPHQRSGVPTGR